MANIQDISPLINELAPKQPHLYQALKLLNNNVGGIHNDVTNITNIKEGGVSVVNTFPTVKTKQVQGTGSRSISDHFGDHINLLDFAVQFSDLSDYGPIITAALLAVTALGRGELYIPGSLYPIKTPIFCTYSNIRIYGDRESTIISILTDMPTGYGCWDFAQGCQNVTITEMLFEGNILVPVKIDYAVVTDPMQTNLISSSMFWLHGCVGIKIADCTIQHTNGYAIVVDCTQASNSFIVLDTILFQYNRPNLFGTGSDINYGSWTGGVFYVTDGVNYNLSDFLVKNCTWKSCVGHNLWGHSYANNFLSTNINITSPTISDCGLDGIQLCNINGGALINPVYRRVGWVVLTDGAAGTPKWYNPVTPPVTGMTESEIEAVAIDCSGVVRNFSIANATGLSINGGAYNLDGFGTGCSISGGGFRQPSVGDPEYTEDNIANCGPAQQIGQNWSYGIDTGNTDNTIWGGANVTIGGGISFVGLGGGCRFNGSRYNQFSDFNITHPANGKYPPILIDNIGTGANQRSYGNVFQSGTISWSPSVGNLACIVETAGGGAFLSGDTNFVINIKIISTTGCYSFSPDPGGLTGSTTALTIPGVNSATSGQQSDTIIQREGVGTTSVLRFYSDTGSGGFSKASLIDIGVPSTDSPLLNVSHQDTAGTGVITTGNRTNASVEDLMATSVLYADGMLVITDSTYADPIAELFSSSYCLIRFNGSNLQFSINSGSSQPYTLNWTNFGTGGGGSPGGPNGSVQINNSGTFAGFGELVFDSSHNNLRFWDGTATTHGSVVCSGGFLNIASNGFISSGPAWAQDDTTKYSSIVSLQQSTTDGLIYFGFISPGTTSFVIKAGLNHLGNFGINTMPSASAGQNLTVAGTAGDPGVVLTGGYFQSDQGLFSTSSAGDAVHLPNGGITALEATFGPVSGSTSYNQVNVQSGGVACGNINLQFQSALVISVNSLGTTKRAGATFGSWNFGQDSAGIGTLDFFFLGPTGSTPLRFHQSLANVGFNTSPSGVSGAIISISGTSGIAGIDLTGGFIQSDQGLLVPNTGSNSYQAIHVASGGGVWSRSNFSEIYTQLGSNSGVPTATSGDSVTTSGCIYWDLSLVALRVYNGSSWATLGTLTVPGSNTQVLFNNSGALGADSSFFFNSTSNLLTVQDLEVTDTNFNSINVPNGGVSAQSVQATELTYNAIASDGGVSCGTGAGGGFFVASTVVIDTGANLHVNGVNAVSAIFSGGVEAAGFNPTGNTGATDHATFSATFTTSGGPFHTFNFQGGAFIGFS